MKAKKINKYLYGYKFYVNYGQGYEYEGFCLNRRELKEMIKDYSVNCPQYSIKYNAGRELNPSFKS